MSDPIKERLDFLTKKLNKQEAAFRSLNDRVCALENKFIRLVEGVRRGLPHMNLKEFLDDNPG